MKAEKLKKIGVTIILTFLIGGVLFALFSRYQLFHHYSFTTGQIRGITTAKARGAYTILYDYRVNKSLHHGEQTFDYCPGWGRKRLDSFLRGKQFPVVYAVNLPFADNLLIKKGRAALFNYKLPDSVLYYDSVLTCQQ